MKKLTLILVTLVLVLGISCKKDSDSTQKTNQSNKITNQLLSFKQNMLLKSNGSLPSDSAVWYLEGLLNLENANNNHDFNGLDFYNDTLSCTVNSNSISVAELDQLYQQITTWLNALKAENPNTNYTFDIVDLELLTNSLKSSSEELKVIASAGIIGTTHNYEPFGPDDYWIWGSGLGKCGSYSGQFIGRDATTELEQHINYPFHLIPGPSYWISCTTRIAQYFNYNNIGNSNVIMMFQDSGEGNGPIIQPCLGYYELNYYLDHFDYIKNDMQPAGLTFKNVDVVEAIVVYNRTWDYSHEYRITYGKNIIFAD